MAGCGADAARSDTGGSTDTTAATATDTESDTPVSGPTRIDTSTPLIEGEPAPDTALALSEQLAEILASATEEFGDVGVDLLQFGPHFTSLYSVDPAMPDTRSRSEHLDASWITPLGMHRRDTKPPVPLDAIDPEILRSLVEASPVVLETGLSRLCHVSIRPDESGQAEYQVTLYFGTTATGSATFDARGEVRDIKPFT